MLEQGMLGKRHDTLIKTYTISNGSHDLFDRLIKDGIIYKDEAGDLILDHTKCKDPGVRAIDADSVKVFSPLGKGDLGWRSFKEIKTLPEDVVRKQYPDEMFAYTRMEDHRVMDRRYVRGDMQVTPDGRPYEGMLQFVPDTMIKESGAKDTLAVRLPVDNSDKRLAVMYVDRADLFVSGRSGYSNIAIWDMGKPVEVYRKLESEAKSKEQWMPADLISAVDKARSELRAERARTRFKDIKAGIEPAPEDVYGDDF